jgi:hypothetical protein
MKRPTALTEQQQAFLDKQPEAERAFHALMFRVGNAGYEYYHNPEVVEVTEDDFAQWLDEMPEKMKRTMQAKGFEACQFMLPFRRYVLAKKDIRLEDYLKQHLSPEDWAAWQELQKGDATDGPKG